MSLYPRWDPLISNFHTSSHLIFPIIVWGNDFTNKETEIQWVQELRTYMESHREPVPGQSDPKSLSCVEQLSSDAWELFALELPGLPDKNTDTWTQLSPFELISLRRRTRNIFLTSPQNDSRHTKIWEPLNWITHILCVAFCVSITKHSI